MKYTYIIDEMMEEYYFAKNYKIGDKVLVYSRYYTLTGKEYFYISSRLADKGMGGNMDNSIKMYHGWRGETDNVATYAYGVYEVKSIEKRKNPNELVNEIKVKIGRKDFKKDEM